MAIHICAIEASSCKYTYPDCPKKVEISKGVYFPCPTLSEYFRTFGEQDDQALHAMAYEVGITFAKIKKIYIAARKKADIQVQRN